MLSLLDEEVALLIHPFVDGNGRVGRLMLNFLLVQQGHPPAVILAEKRRQYLRALRTADGGNPNPLTEVVARAASGAMSKFLIRKLAGEAKLVPLSALASSSGYSVDYLRQLAWLDAYVAQRDPRGGPPGRRRRDASS